MTATVRKLAALQQIALRTGPEILAHQLREQILSGVFPKGSALAPERELAEQTGLSRPTVRAALRILETEGLVETKQGRHGGAFVRQLDESDLSKTLNMFIRGLPVAMTDLLETRKVIEVAIARFAAERRTAEDLKDMAAILDRIARAERENPVEMLRESIMLRLAIAKAAHNDLLIAIMGAFSTAQQPSEGDREVIRRLGAEGRQALVRAQRRIHDAIAAGDVEAATRRTVRHFEAYEALLQREKIIPPTRAAARKKK
jgi:DNA-binding FadR family transcriptional regulator